MIILEQESKYMATYIVPQKKLGYSNIFLDFISKNENSNEFYPAHSFASVAKELNSQSFNRDNIADILVEQNKQFGSSKKFLKILNCFAMIRHWSLQLDNKLVFLVALS